MVDVNPKDVPSMAPQIIAIAIVSCSLATIFVVLRFYTRLRITRSIGWDDYATLATLPFCILDCVFISMSTRYGAGLRTWDLPTDLEGKIQMWTFVASFFYLPSLLGYKMSILFLYLRIFKIEKVFRYCTWLVMFITFGYIFSNAWTQLFNCPPIIKYWRPDIPGHCDSSTKPPLIYGSLNIITDLLIFVLPLPMVWRMQLTLKEAIEVSVIFILGSL